MIKAVIWDIGGVLLKNPKYKEFWKDSKSFDLRRSFSSGKISTKQFIEKGADLLKISGSEFLKKYKSSYFSVRLIYQTYNIFKNIKINNYILSDTNPLNSKHIKKSFPEIFNKCKKVYLSDEIKLRKDSLDIFKFVIKDLKLKPSEILFIDDKKRATDLAKKVGINSITYVSSNNLKLNLKKYNLI